MDRLSGGDGVNKLRKFIDVIFFGEGILPLLTVVSLFFGLVFGVVVVELTEEGKSNRVLVFPSIGRKIHFLIITIN